MNPHNAVARLAGSFDSISHDVNQPLSQVIRTGQATIFAATPAMILQPRTAIAWQIAPQTVLRSGFGLFSDILPGSVVDLVGTNPPYSKTFQGGLLGTAGGSAIAPGVPNSAIDATAAANRLFNSGFAQGQLSCASPLANPNSCLPPISITAVPDGRLHAPYFMQWSFAVERQLGTALNLRAQYVGTRAVNQPYQTQVNGYQTVCQGCFAPFPFGQPKDARFGPVTQLSTGANSHYNGLQLTADKRLGHGIQVQTNYTWSRCMDTVSNGGFLPFAAGAILSPLPGDLGRQYGPCDYDVRHNFTAQYVYQLPMKFRNRILARTLNGWQVSGTVFWHSGVPFSVLSAPYSANGNGMVQGSGSQYASVIPGVPLVRTQSQSPASLNLEPSSGSTRTRWFRPSTRAPAPVPAATVPGIANSAILAGTHCAVLISSGAICILPSGSCWQNKSSCASTVNSSTSSIIRISDFRCWGTREFPANLPRRPDSEHSATRHRPRPDC